MLASANPDQLKGTSYTVRQMLDDFAGSIGERLTDQPAVEAELRSTIGTAYWRLGEGEAAVKHHTRALELRRRALGPGDEKVADSLCDLALGHQECLEFARGERHAAEALKIYRARGTSGRPLLRALWIMQMVLTRQHRFIESQAFAHAALDVARQAPDGMSWPELAPVYHSLSDAQSHNGEFEDAARSAREAIRLNRIRRGEQDVHPETGWAYVVLSRAEGGLSNFTESLDAAKRALTIFRTSYPVGHWAIGIPLQHITEAAEEAGAAGVLWQQFPTTQSVKLLEDLYRGVIDATPTTLGKRDWGATAAANGLGQCVGIYLMLADEYAALERPVEAETARRRASTLLATLPVERGQDQDAMLLAATYSGLVKSLCGAGRRGEARALGQKLLACGDVTELGDLAWELCKSPDADKRDPQLAVELAQAVVKAYPAQGESWGQLGVVRFYAGDAAGAARDLERHLELTGGGTSYTLFHLAMARHSLGDTVAARKYYDLGVEWQARNAPGRPTIAKYRAQAERALNINDPARAPATRPVTSSSGAAR
jgi:tetratricopeptide (TPR) repeat protein